MRATLEREWLWSALSPNLHYSVSDDVHTPTPEGDVKLQEQTTYFGLLAGAKGSSRPHAMPTYESPEDPMRTAKLAVQVQFYEATEGTEGTGDSRIVHREGDIEWVPLSRIASFDAFWSRCYRWKRVEASTEHVACLQWSHPEAAKPLVALTHDHCPTLALTDALEHQYHLVPVQHTVIHTPDGPAEFDAREATRMRAYYQVCLDLKTFLPLAGGRIPSQEPVNFYKLLLRRLQAVPGESAAHYLKILNHDSKQRKLEPLPLEKPEPPPALGAGDEVLVPPPPGVPVPVPKPKAEPRVGRRVDGEGRPMTSTDSGGPRRPPAPPPLPVPPGPGVVETENEEDCCAATTAAKSCAA